MGAPSKDLPPQPPMAHVVSRRHKRQRFRPLVPFLSLDSVLLLPLPRLLPVRMRSDEEHLANVGRAALLGHDGASAGGANAAGPSQPRDALSSCAIQVDEVKDVMKRNVDQMLQNMDKTANLETSTQELAQQANAFRSTARRTRKKMCWQNAKMYLALSGTCLIFLLIVGWASGWFSR